MYMYIVIVVVERDKTRRNETMFCESSIAQASLNRLPKYRQVRNRREENHRCITTLSLSLKKKCKDKHKSKSK
jgi:hypothetical protein